MLVPGVHLETLEDPSTYAPAQLERACLIAAMLNRGKFILLERPVPAR
jgi:hypothetical protein